MGEGSEADVSNGLRWCGIAVWAGLWLSAGEAQQGSVAAPSGSAVALSATDSSATLSAMAAQAAVIFAGHVTTVSRH